MIGSINFDLQSFEASHKEAKFDIEGSKKNGGGKRS